MKLKIDDIMNVAIATNGVPKSTFCDASIGELECQAVHGWAEQSSIIRFRNGVLTGPEYPFDARDGDKYVQSPFNTFNSDTWYELWIQLDVPNLNARYYLRELGDSATPVAMLDETGSSDWGFRELFRFQITTLKFNIEASPDYTCDNSSGGNCQYAEMLIDDIGIDQSGWSLQSVPEPTTLGLLVVGSLMMIRRR